MRCKAIIYLISLLLAACGNEREVFVVEEVDLTVSVYATATIQSKDQYRVFAPVSGILLETAVQEGDLISNNQIIARIDNSNPNLASENARLQLNLARGNLNGPASPLRRLELEIDVARQRMVEDSVNYERQQSLWSQGIGSQSQLENRALAKKSSQNQYRSLKKQFELTKSELEMAVQISENNYQMSQKSAGDFEVRSVMDGRVYALYKEPGEMVTLQEPLALIGHAGEFIVQLDVDEKDIAQVEPGQLVILRMDAYRDQTFEAIVSRILPLMNTRSQTFTVEATFSQPMGQLYSGMSAEANIVAEVREGILSIPTAYLEEGKFVYISSSERKVVTTGIRGGDRVEITEGLGKGDVIYKPNR